MAEPDTTRATYSASFYSAYNDSSRLSASLIVPKVLELVAPDSVIDVGCGEAVWLSVFDEHGVKTLLGVDGDYVNRSRLLIPADKFVEHDLSTPLRRPERYSLAISLEVAEHLPERSARDFVESLTRLADVVMFSAAIPFQTGFNHINLQWQSYWAKLFAERDYVAVDALRPLIWEDDRISFWYRQNTLLYVQRDHLSARVPLAEARRRTNDGQLSMVHPLMATYLGDGGPSDAQLDKLYLGRVVPRLPAIFWRSVKHRLRGG